MKLYVVMLDDYDAYYPEGVYSTKEIAIEKADALRERSAKDEKYKSHYKVLEYNLDETVLAIRTDQYVYHTRKPTLK